MRVAYTKTIFCLVIGPSMLIRLLLPTKSFRRTLLNHSISKAVTVHDLLCFRREVLASGSRLRQVCFGYFLPNLLLRMRRNGHSCSSDVSVNIENWLNVGCHLHPHPHPHREFWRILRH